MGQYDEQEQIETTKLIKVMRWYVVKWGDNPAMTRVMNGDEYRTLVDQSKVLYESDSYDEDKRKCKEILKKDLRKSILKKMKMLKENMDERISIMNVINTEMKLYSNID